MIEIEKTSRQVLLKRIIWVVVFAITMGYLEASIVVYLREIYYPEGFGFPLQVFDAEIAVTEIIREAATMIMIVAVAVLSFGNGPARLGGFLLIFAIWDITYYAFLKALLGWPGSLLTWDILFLIPLTWTGPVLAPVINSLTMFLLAGALILRNPVRVSIPLSIYEWALLITGAGITITGYVFDYAGYLLERIPLKEIFSLPMNEGIMDYSLDYIPGKFNWFLFIAGELYFLLAIISYLRRNKGIPGKNS
jgi:hypothetical protein